MNRKEINIPVDVHMPATKETLYHCVVFVSLSFLLWYKG